MSSATLAYEPLKLSRPIGAWIFGTAEGRHLLEREILPAWLPSRRWFGGKSRRIERVSVDAAIPWRDLPASVLAIGVHHVGKPPDRYLVPLAYGSGTEFDNEAGVVARDEESNVLSDALFSAAFRAALLQLIVSGGVAGSGDQVITGRSSEFVRRVDVETSKESRLLGVEQSNNSIIYGGKLFLKLFRRLDPGMNPDAEITRFLSERQGFRYVPPYAGELELRLGDTTCPMALLLGCVENRGDAWAWALASLEKYYAGADNTDALARIARLGQYTAEMHLALARDETEPAFRPEPLTAQDFDQLAASVSSRLDALLPVLRARKVDGDSLAGEVLAREVAVRESIAALKALPPGAAKTRHHGDYHLGQVLDTGGDWMIIDFEGEPTRTLAERREKRSPLRDVAGMLRSFHYAAHSACPTRESDARKRAEEWTDAASAAFLHRYMEIADGSVVLPANPAGRASLLRAYILEKALYEIDYELNNRPDWLAIPMRGLLRALEA